MPPGGGGDGRGWNGAFTHDCTRSHIACLEGRVGCWLKGQGSMLNIDGEALVCAAPVAVSPENGPPGAHSGHVGCCQAGFAAQGSCSAPRLCPAPLPSPLPHLCPTFAPPLPHLCPTFAPPYPTPPPHMMYCRNLNSREAWQSGSPMPVWVPCASSWVPCGMNVA